MLADLIAKIAENEAAERGEQKYRSRPSSAGPERCIRQLVYFANDTQKDPSNARKWLVFDDSSWHEELTADWLRRSAFNLHSQQMEVKTKCGLGHIDGIITDMQWNEWLYEHKAINHFTFERYWRGQMPLDYLTQLALYIEGIQADQPEITKGILLVKNKNTAQYLEMICDYDKETDTLTVRNITHSDGEFKEVDFEVPNITSDAALKFEEVEKHLKEKTLPIRPYSIGTEFPCGYCPYNTTCWGGFEAEYRQYAEGIADDLMPLAEGYYNCRDNESFAKKKKEQIKQEIMASMFSRSLKSCLAGEYFINIKMNKNGESVRFSLNKTKNGEKNEIQAD